MNANTETGDPNLVDPREAYYSLADELTDEKAQPFTEADWDPGYVEAAKEYAVANDLPFPPPPMASGIVMTVQSFGKPR